MSHYTECACRRGDYDKDKFNSCYACYQERHDGYDECIWCGAWHSPIFNTCYKCRAIPGRDDAATEVRRMVITRDHFECRYCGDDENLQVDHIMPCARGGTADPWNLQTLCAPCNRHKGSEWSDYGRHAKARNESVEAYYTYLWDYLTELEKYWLNLEVIEWLGYSPRGTINLAKNGDAS
jgi:5-methylcytosine-specific restriction endonuclease McrA